MVDTKFVDSDSDALYIQEVEVLVDSFRYENCDCGGDLRTHLIGPDPLGHAHLYCMTGDSDS